MRPEGHLSISELAERLEMPAHQARAYVWAVYQNHPELDPPLIKRRTGARRGRANTWLWVNEEQAYKLLPRLRNRSTEKEIARVDRRLDRVQLLAERVSREHGETVRRVERLEQAGKR